MRKLRLALLVFAVGVMSVVSPSSAGTSYGLTVVMTGLDQPRGLAFGPDAALYVAEAGAGGRQPCFEEGPTGPTFYGPSGAISRLRKGVQERILTGLPSAIDGNGFVVAGPVDILVGGGGNVAVAIGLANEPAARAECGPAGSMFGTLVHYAPNGKEKRITDVAAYEATTNPDGGHVESNPYGISARPGATVVADAAGNSLLEIGSNGRITPLAVFPSRSTGRAIDSVPTSVARGPDGAYYIGELSGIPYPTGAANIYRLVPGGGGPKVFLSGFTAVIDIAFGPDESLYVLQFATGAELSGPGALIRITTDGSRTTVASDGLIAPSAVAVAPDGTIYVSNCGVFPASGEAPCHGHVVRIDT